MFEDPEQPDWYELSEADAAEDADAYAYADEDAYLPLDAPEDEQPTGWGRLRWAVRLIAGILLVVFGTWAFTQAGFIRLGPRHDSQGRPISHSGQAVPRSPVRVLQEGTWHLTYEFWFDGAIRTIDFELSQADYSSSESRPTAIVVSESESERSWTRRFYTRAFDWTEQQRAIETVLVQLRRMRASLGLGSDDYVRLMNAFVGTIPYESDEDEDEGEAPTRKYPCSLLVEGSGVCEAKSMLLGGMLVAEGYDAALILLEADEHMAVGVRSDLDTYKDTPYTFIDAVGRSVLEPSLEYREPIEVGTSARKYKSKPLVVPLAEGGTRFGVE